MSKEHSRRRNLCSPAYWTSIKKNKLVKFYIWSILLLDADTWTLESNDMWCWRGIEKVSWTDRVKNEVVLIRHGGKEYPTYTTRIGHILHRNSLLRLVFEGTIEGTWRRGRRHKPLLDETRKTKSYWEMKRTQFSRSYGLVVRYNTKWMTERMNERENQYKTISRCNVITLQS